MQYGMAIDLKKCMGCQTCATACKLANNLPSGNWWNRIHTEGGATIDTAAGDYPNCRLEHYPIACQHCAEPACVLVCPTGATWKDEENGIVRLDPETCIGCKSCIEACPYGARVYNNGEPAYALEFAVGNEDAPAHLANTVEKCTFCSNLLEKEELPMCVQACIGYARTFGDLDDPASDVAKLIASRETVQLFAEEGTKPSIYYLK